MSFSPKRLGIVSPRNTKPTKREFFESSLHLQKVRQKALRIDAPSMGPTLVSPITSPLHTPSTSPSDAPQVSLDLTVPTPQLPRTLTPENSTEFAVSNTADGMQQQANHRNPSYLEDPDILAGCRALLSFSHGLHSLTA
eukprot:CAMPEP_0116110250 /NCGR_PEP_ID=MMETSP0327-20121206/17804_1 /TAXON_ID=44447 /ORGANISM="Pseudo-nitzschia delicatissima, Strain B596" /LENGTH=138 /DNA_ID=CAMNT_0003603387 /DNA_START=442 /DNA_END=858 /DNA_ORIENTATION=+